jgi:hypothetical protein
MHLERRAVLWPDLAARIELAMGIDMEENIAGDAVISTMRRYGG